MKGSVNNVDAKAANRLSRDLDGSRQSWLARLTERGSHRELRPRRQTLSDYFRRQNKRISPAI